MTLSLSEIPSATEKPSATHKPSTALSLVDAKSHRRSILQMVAIAGVAAGGTVLGWGSRGRPAKADVGVLWTRNEWSDHKCHYNYTPDGDTGGAYQGKAAACNGGTYRSSEYCTSTGWHRSDTGGAGPASRTYTPVNTRCWSSSNGMNAWRWNTSIGCFRCSDGVMKVCYTSCSTYPTVCRFKVSHCG